MNKDGQSTVFFVRKGVILEVKINKEIRNYTESMFFGLSMRQFFFALIGVAVAVLMYFTLKSSLGVETLSWVCMLGQRPSLRWDSSATTVCPRNSSP